MTDLTKWVTYLESAYRQWNWYQKLTASEILNLNYLMSIEIHYYYYSSSNKDASGSRLDTYPTKSGFN